MEKIKIHRKQGNIEYAFEQSVVRGKHGRFIMNPYAKKHRESLIIGVMFVCFCIVSFLFIGRMVQDWQRPSEIISPLP